MISDFTEDLTLPEGVVSIKAELLDAFADRGLSDTVEFRRLARKYLRPVRHANCKVALFFSPICAEEKTQKILKQILGTQIKPVFLTEFIPAELFAPAEKQSIEIFTAKNTERVHAEAEKFLRMKLGKGAISNI